MKRAIPFLCTILILTATGFIGLGQEDLPFHFSLQPESLQIARGSEGAFTLEVVIDRGHFLYQDMFSVTAETPAGLRLLAPQYPPAHQKYDPFTETEKMIYDGTLRVACKVAADAAAPAQGAITVLVGYQGCSATMCFLPDTVKLKLPFTVKGTSAPAAAATTAPAGSQSPSPAGKPGVAPTAPATTPAPPPVSEPPAAATPGPEPGPGPATPPAPASTAPPPLPAPPTGPLAADEDDIGNWLKGSYLWAFLFVFVIGIGTSFTPCVFPLIPITVSLFGAKGAETKLKGFLLSFTYVQGIALMYSCLGLAVALSGAIFGQFMSNPWVVGGIVTVFVLLGLFMAGVFNFNLPTGLQTKASTIGGKGFAGAFSMGLVAGVIAAPCAGPILASILAWVATTKDGVLGFFLLYTYALGFGLLFIAIGTFSTLIGKLPRSGDWMEVVKGVFGATMFGVALFYLKDIWPSLRLESLSRDALLLAGPLLVVIGFLVRGLRHDLHMATTRQALHKWLALLLLTVGGFAFVVGLIRPAEPSAREAGPKSGPAWEYDLAAGLERAKQSGKPALVDFYADWCAACKELDHYTYSNPEVLAELERFVVIKVDMTRPLPRDAQLKTDYALVGLPVVAFHGRDGALLRHPRVTGFVPAEKFLEVLRQLP